MSPDAWARRCRPNSCFCIFSLRSRSCRRWVATLRSSILSVYVAAALSFGAGVWRDWQLVHHVQGYAQVFGAMYCVALAASFSVNAVTLGHGFHRHPGRQWLLAGFSLLLFGLLVHFWQPMSAYLFWWMLPVPALYVIGALYSRRLLDAGHVLVGRLRDGASSLCMVLLIAVGVGLESFALAVLVGTSLIALAMYYLPAKRHEEVAPRQSMAFTHYIAIIFYSNIASVLVNAWAMWANNHEGVLFGYAVPVVVRVSMYGFQLLSLPSVLLSRWRPSAGSRKYLGLLAWVCIALALIVASLPIHLSVFLLPLASLAALYSSVLLMNAYHFGESVR